MAGRVGNALAVLVDRIAQEERLDDARDLRLELIGDGDGALLEAPARGAHLVALEVVGVGVLGERDAVLRRRVTEAVRAENRQRLLAELVGDEDVAVSECGLRDAVAHAVNGRVADALAVLVRRVAQTVWALDVGAGRAELVREVDRASAEAREARLARLIALEVLALLQRGARRAARGRRR